MFSFSYEDLERDLNMKYLYADAKKKKGSAKLPEYVCHYSAEPAVVETSADDKKKQ